MGLPIRVTKDVLIPRDDTQVLAETAIDLLRSRPISGTRVLDLCTGSGCVGISLAANVPDCRVVCIDVSRPALDVCRSNVELNRLTRCVTCMDADALRTPPVGIGSFDLIVSNPPYIPTEEIETLDASVREYEPRLALDGGEDGLKFYRAAAEKWSVLLRQGGGMVFECGEGQADAVQAILEENGFENVFRQKDTLGVDRVVAGRRNG